MGSPTPGTTLTTLRPDLRSMIEFDLERDRKGFIGHRLLPVINVALQADSPGRIKLEELLKGGDLSRTSSGGYSRGTLKFEKWAYATEEWGREEVVTKRLARLYSNYIDAEAVAATRARDMVLREREKRVVALVQDTGVYTGATLATAATAAWSTLASAKPITDVRNAKLKSWALTGLWPNIVAMNLEQFEFCRATAEVIDHIASSGAGSSVKASDVTARMLAQCFAVDEVLVAGGSKDSADEGQTRSIAHIWNRTSVSVARIATSNDVQEPCLGRTFHWTEDGSTEEGTIEEYEDPTTRSHVIRCRQETDEVLMYHQCAHLITGVLA